MRKNTNQMRLLAICTALLLGGGYVSCAFRE